MLENDIKTLIKILEESNIDELEVSTFWGKQKICIRKSSPLHSPNTESSTGKPIQTTKEEILIQTNETQTKTDDEIKPEPFESSIEQEKTYQPEDTITIKAPLVGTFYTSPKPNTPPFISEGDDIKEGQIICIIEAMKIFNEIESEYSGKILKILVDDGTPVEFDQDLLLITH